jgi:hypothetical protein
MFNIFFYKSFTNKQESVCGLNTHLIEYQFGKTEDNGDLVFSYLTFHDSDLFNWTANIDSGYNQYKFCLYFLLVVY